MEKNGVMDAVARDLQTLFDTGVMGALSRIIRTHSCSQRLSLEWRVRACEFRCGAHHPQPVL